MTVGLDNEKVLEQARAFAATHRETRILVLCASAADGDMMVGNLSNLELLGLLELTKERAMAELRPKRAEKRNA